MNILSLLKLSINSLTTYILILNICFNILFLKYMLFILIIYGSIIYLRSHNKIANYYNINSNLLTIGHIISHYLIPFYFLHNYNFKNNKLIFKQYIYGILFSYFYFFLVDIENIYFIDKVKIQIEVFILWTIIYIFSNIL